MTETTTAIDISVWSQTDWQNGVTQFCASRGDEIIARSGWYPAPADAWQALGKQLGWL
ncbi:hypothetical protein M2302_002250 [Micromonospora sp. A200]|uniref:hypothetical protein n=1 Tax=Micromonospora sp. A200 TaxID=2940568 RepID=UPI00247365DB|nr:hypothetical protein [Micromonospora sp. A200]MDH6462075.1 hypothetical protein [Micromonospora sp. A200]